MVAASGTAVSCVRLINMHICTLSLMKHAHAVVVAKLCL
jgi:hypothetical protein